MYSGQNILVGLGWDVSKRSFLDKVRGVLTTATFTASLDVDLSLVLCGRDGAPLSEVPEQTCTYYAHTDMFGAVHHSGDKVAREGQESSEEITIDLKSLPGIVKRFVVVVTIKNAKSNKQEFSQAGNAYVTLIDPDSKTEFGNLELAKGFAGMNGVIAFEFSRVENGWQVKRVAKGYDDIAEITDIIAKCR